MKNTEALGWKMLRTLLLLLGAFLVLAPLYLVFINSFKTMQEAGASFFSLPASFSTTNLQRLFESHNYWGYVKNSAVITIVSVFFVVLLVPSVSYAIARNYHRPYYKFVYFYLLMGLFIPSQVIMLPLTKFMTKMGWLNQGGLIILYATFSLTQGVFLFTNYIRSLPIEIEEAARVDGCNVFQVYYRIILHMVKPMLSTIIIMDVLWFWNDFMLPLLILNKDKSFWTLPLFQYNFKTEYAFDYPMAFTAYLMAIIPVLVVYCLGQKYIIKGLTAGAVKG